MIYAFFAVLYTAFLIWLTVIGEKKPTLRRKLTLVNVFLALIGALVIPIVHLTVRNNIFFGDHDQIWTEWAWDMFTIYYSVSIPVVCVLLGILFLSAVLSLFSKRRKGDTAPRLRIITSCAASVVMIIIAPSYAFMTENDVLPIDTYIMILGFAQSLLFRASVSLEYLAEACGNVKRK